MTVSDLRSRRLRPILLAGLLVSGTLACQSAPQEQPQPAEEQKAELAAAEFEVLRETRFYESEEPLTSVRIVNPYGDLRVRNADRNALGLSLVIQKLAPEWVEPEFVVEQGEGRISLEVRYETEAAQARARFGRPGRVDLVAFLPQDVALDLHTEDGSLQVRHRRGPIGAQSSSGSIQASSEQGLNLLSESGSIFARRFGDAEGSGWKVHTSKGDVHVMLSRRADYLLRVRAGGGIQLGAGWYPQDQFVVPEGALELERRFNQGGAEFLIASDAGGVVLGAAADLEDDWAGQRED